MAVTADRTDWDAYLFELQGTVHEAFSAEAPFLSELSGYTTAENPVGSNGPGRITQAMDGNRDIFTGSQVRHTVDLSTMQSGGWPGEEGTWNAPSATSAVKIFDYLRDFVQPFSVSVDVERDSMNHSNADAVTRLTEKAGQSCALNENLALLGDGTGLITTVASNVGSPGLTIPVPDSANFDVLLPGTIWDILTVTTGANPGNGLRRSIASVVETPGAKTITFNTAATATDGNSGNITFANTSGIYIPGSYSVPNAVSTSFVPNGLEQASAISGTFQGLSKTTYPQWQGTDGRSGDTSTKALSEAMLMAGALKARRYGGLTWDFGIGDPAAINLYIESFFAQRLFQPDTMTLKSGWSGAVFNGAGVKPFPLISDLMHAKSGLHLIEKSQIQLYGDSKGPSFLDDDGARFRRFSRSLVKEAEMLDRMNALYTNCSRLVFFHNLAQATA